MRSHWFSVLTAWLLFLISASAFAQNAIPLWPSAATTSPVKETDTTTEKSDRVAGKRVQRLTGVTQPSVAVYRAPAANGSAVVVFPGGGYRILAYDLEGTEVCDWLNSLGTTCVLLKYRVPDAGPYPKHAEALADAQRAVRLTRQHAAEWGVDPRRIGVLGFSAGGHLAAVLSNHAGEQVYPPSDAADKLSARPDFAVLLYPAYIVQPPDLVHISPVVVPTAQTPPTFIVQAEDDGVHVENGLVYYQALKNAAVKAEMHLFAQGGHGYGLRPTALPVTRWPKLAEEWFHTIGVISQEGAKSTR